MHPNDDVLARLQAIIDRSAKSAGPAIRQNFIGGGWQMTAAEFVSFWDARPMAAISTVSAQGSVHITPLDPLFSKGVFRIPTFGDSQRLKDHIANPRCGISAWDGPYRAVIVYGTASIEDPDAVAVTSGALNGYEASGMVTVVVTPTRIYGIRPPEGHRPRP